MSDFRKDDDVIGKLVRDVLSASNINALVLTDQEYDDSVFDAVEYVPFHYLQSWKAFDSAYLANCGGITTNVLIVFVENGETKACWRLDLSKIDGRLRLGTEATSVLAPIFSKNCTVKYKKKITKSCIDIAQIISEKNAVVEWYSADCGPTSTGVSIWHTLLRKQGEDCEVKYDMYINLGSEMSEIKASFRSSYKSLVNQGEKLWNCSVLDSGDESQWNEFHELHTGVSGRETRSQATWDIQYNMICNQSGFAVLLRDESNTLVGGGFFAHSRDEGIYFSGAYDRDLFPLPLGHVVQAKAISVLKDRGVRWYLLGTMAHETGRSPSSTKEASISNFKEGFATHIFPRYIWTHTTSENDIKFEGRY
jgi:FemAB family protein